MITDTSEKGLEDLIVAAMTGSSNAPVTAEVKEPMMPFGGTGWLLGKTENYDREYAVDLHQLRAFLNKTQPDAAETLDLDKNSPVRHKFLARLQGEISKRGVIDVLRKGINHGPHHLDLLRQSG
jgi:type I restriction enzyme R subunit